MACVKIQTQGKDRENGTWPWLTLGTTLAVKFWLPEAGSWELEPSCVSSYLPGLEEISWLLRGFVLSSAKWLTW